MNHPGKRIEHGSAYPELGFPDQTGPLTALPGLQNQSGDQLH